MYIDKKFKISVPGFPKENASFKELIPAVLEPHTSNDLLAVAAASSSNLIEQVKQPMNNNTKKVLSVKPDASRSDKKRKISAANL